MKKYLILSVLAALPFGSAGACAYEGPTNNSYMFSVFRREKLTDGPAYLYDINRYWTEYAGGGDMSGVNFYAWNSDDILKAAKRRGDREMTAYLTQLNKYIKVCNAYSTASWNYPTKQQLAQRRQTLVAVLNAAKAYRGTALRQQYVLLQMRANMMLGYSKSNIALWNSTASRLSGGMWREAMRNIYARALLKSGQRQRACDIYAEQGDVKSIKAVMRNYRNLAGIKSVYAQNPNAPTLEYLVQDFVNNVQETLDNASEDVEDNDYFDLIGAKKIDMRDAKDFVRFANGVAEAGVAKPACLWLAAASMVDFLLGNQAKALDEADRAVRADGTQRMKDNARAIRLLVSTRSNRPSKEYSDFLTAEFKWLDSKIVEERGDDGIYNNHYTDVKDRVVHAALEPLYRKAGLRYQALSMCAMMNAGDVSFDGGTDANIMYSGNYFCAIDSLKADDLAGYYKYVSSPHDDAFEAYACRQAYRDKDYFNDLIGTKLIAEGRFADAIPYMEKVPLSLLGKQHISVYAAMRHYDTPRWFGKQVVDADDYELVAVARNQKLDYCRDMTERLSQYRLAREGEDKRQMAYDLALRYYQASCYGDCWYLTHYGYSVMDSARVGEMDFAQEAVRYLSVAKGSDNLALRCKALYALAFVPTDPWYSVSYDDDYNTVITACPKSRQYAALAELDVFARSNPQATDSYVQRCDVLRRFRGKKW